MADLDPRFTFENFVVGPANRLASAAARRAAESPGESYNPLFVYSASGLGKTHILGAIAHHVGKVYPDKAVVYQTLEGFLDELTEALEGGNRDDGRSRHGSMEILLMDDIQFLAGQSEAQEMLLRKLDALTGAGNQVVIASDRPPADIDGLDARLRSRFEGGLLVDIGPPEYETRVAILRKQAEARGQTLQPEVAEVIGRIPFKNVRELGGALNRILAVQELEERVVTADEAGALLGQVKKETSYGRESDLGSFLDEISGTVAAQVERQEAPWRKELRVAAEEMEAQGFKAQRLRRLMEEDSPPEDVATTLDAYRSAVRRLEQIRDLLEDVGNPWPEAAHGVLQDPERVDEAEALLASARERARPFPDIRPGPGLGEVSASMTPLVVRAAEQLIRTDRPEYNPLYVWSRDGKVSRDLLEAAGRSYQADHRDARVALISVLEFAQDFIGSLSRGVAGAWRERWWSAELLLVHGAQDLSETERAQDEVFHLFEALQRRKARIMFAADRPPSEIGSIDDRLRSRFEGGLVLEVEGAGVERPEVASPGETRKPARETRKEVREDISALDREWIMGFSSGSPVPIGRTPQDAGEDGFDGFQAGKEAEPWFPSPERVIWEWPRIDERVLEDPD
ncbi:MAG: DnaA/Hda family protein [Longimicrobiales bacterium]